MLAGNTRMGYALKKFQFTIIVLVVLITTIGFLCYGNPQSNKYVYIWQAYVWPAETYDPKHNTILRQSNFFSVNS